MIKNRLVSPLKASCFPLLANRIAGRCLLNAKCRSLCARDNLLTALFIVTSLLNSGCAGVGVTHDPPGDPVTSSPWTIKAENTKPGTTEWQNTNPATNREIEG